MNPLDRYTAWVHRSYVASYGVERADREAPSRALYDVAFVAMVVVITIAVVASAADVPVLSGFATACGIALLPLVVIARLRMRSAGRG